MYTLYYVPQACSLATQTVLRELGQDVRLVNKNDHHDFKSINPVGTVPVIDDGKQIIKEGAAVMLHILKQHPNPLFPKDEMGQIQAIQNIMFANATMHPAYSKLFFIAQNIHDESAKREAFNAATTSINNLWQVVESELATKEVAGNDNITAAEIMLSVYATWGQYFPVVLIFGERTSKMITAVQSMPSFKKAVQAEQVDSAR